jgi:hypothetical protein
MTRTSARRQDDRDTSRATEFDAAQSGCAQQFLGIAAGGVGFERARQRHPR